LNCRNEARDFQGRLARGGCPRRAGHIAAPLGKTYGSLRKSVLARANAIV
jgi:hypothetical protein